MKDEMESRRERARKLMRNKGYDALVLAAGENIQYFSGVTEPSVHACGDVILSQNAQLALAVMWLDKKAAHEQVEDVDVHAYNPDSHGKVIAKMLQNLGVTKGVIGMDDRAMKVLKNALGQSLSSVGLVDASRAVEELRRIKSEGEIRYIRKACEIADEGMKAALEALKPGATELQIAATAEHKMMMLGSDRLKHRTMVASGPRARLVHPFASHKKIAKGELVVIDLGGVCQGYCSDITRTTFIGRPSEDEKDDLDVLRSAQEAVFGKLRGGIAIREVEETAQEVLKAAGCRLIDFVGHSVGLKVEESPFLRTTRTSHPEAKIEKNVVVAFFQSYIQSKRSWGIRLEDTVAVTKLGAKMLTTYPRDLL